MTDTSLAPAPAPASADPTDAVTLRRWATATWRGIEASLEPATGLPGDSIGRELDAGSRAAYTSPANIAGALWSLVCARDLGLLDEPAAGDRLGAILRTLAVMDRHEPSGMFYNWYAAPTGAVLTTWPVGRGRVTPFLSAVDNGWLAAALMAAGRACPQIADAAATTLSDMRFDAYLDPAPAGARGPLLRGGFWPTKPRRGSTRADYGFGTVYYTQHHYGLLNSEPRIASYVGMARGQLPTEHLAALRAPLRRYRRYTVVATCGGSMFEALSPELFVPETAWAPATWGLTHANTVAAQREYARVRKFSHWGFSPASVPGDGYKEFGVAPIAWLPRGYRSTWHGEPVVTPHASALALLHDAPAAVANLAALECDLSCYTEGGFLDSVGLRSGRTADRFLMIDQAMVLASIATVLCDGGLRRWFCSPEATGLLRPVVAEVLTPVLTPG